MAASMKTICSLLISLIMVALLSHAKTFEKSQMGEKMENGLEAISIKQRDAYLFSLWELYKSSPSFERSIADAITKIVYIDTKINMLGLILFGATNHWSILRSVRDENLPFVDDQQCLKSTMESFVEHCGVVNEHHIRQALANICNYVTEKSAIDEAILVVCAMPSSESYDIDVGNPKIDLTPAPIHGTSQYCGRVSVNGISRMKLQSYAKAYQLTLVPSQSIPERYDNLIQVCFHRNDSLGLCECEKDDWTSVQRRFWSSTMSPYEQRFVDVKFIVQLSDSVTITLVEVSQGWRYILLVGGIALLFMAVSKDIFDEYVVDVGMVQFAKWVMRVLAVTCIFMSSSDTPLAMAAVCACLALCYVITSIIALLSPKKTIRNRKKFSGKVLTRQFVAELASSHEFEEWVINNAHRIRVGPKKKKWIRWM